MTLLPQQENECCHTGEAAREFPKEVKEPTRDQNVPGPNLIKLIWTSGLKYCYQRSVVGMKGFNLSDNVWGGLMGQKHPWESREPEFPTRTLSAKSFTQSAPGFNVVG